jgi:ribonuclease E
MIVVRCRVPHYTGLSGWGHFAEVGELVTVSQAISEAEVAKFVDLGYVEIVAPDAAPVAAVEPAPVVAVVVEAPVADAPVADAPVADAPVVSVVDAPADPGVDAAPADVVADAPTDAPKRRKKG